MISICRALHILRAGSPMAFDQFSFELLMAGLKATQRKLDAVECGVERIERVLDRINRIVVEDNE